MEYVAYLTKLGKTNSTDTTSYPIKNCYNKPSTNTSSSGAFYFTGGSNKTTYCEVMFDDVTLGIPGNTIIKDVTVVVKIKQTNSTFSSLSSRKVTFISNNQLTNNEQTFTEGTHTVKLNLGTITLSQLVDCGIRITCVTRSSFLNFGGGYVYIYGADITITYEENKKKSFIKKNGIWTEARTVYVKVDDEWKEIRQITKL